MLKKLLSLQSLSWPVLWSMLGTSGHALGVEPLAQTTAAAQHAHTNRLVNETSPYLLQHAHNPVDWRPWGIDAFEAARSEDKPIFLSIGYSTCYWCHVMERECFENEEIAATMNKHFVCIKVDREERPDVDDIYMTATQITTGSGGWPMSVWLEPQTLKPIVAGTYFPPEDRHGLPAFPRVLEHIADLWQTQREAVLQQADQIAGAVKTQLSQAQEPVAIGQSQVDLATAQLMDVYDARDGGFVGSPRRAPKFPTPTNLDFLIGAAWENASVHAAVLHTLDRMAMGGMFDQIGGGFHRYSVDEKWLVPHFEKMLYDNGQLASTYTRAFELTGDEFYANTLRRTLDYVLREMTHAEGGFFSAQDAEVNTREGGNYLWTSDEVRAALTEAGLEADVDFALEAYGFTRRTNFQDPHHPEDPPTNVVFLIDKPARLAAKISMSLDECNARLARINAALLAVRDHRQQPSTDDKILAGWNGLMIAGMADGGRVLKDQRYLEAAARAARFVLRTMRTSDRSLMRSWRNGTAKIEAFLEDYALVIHGLLALHFATGDRQWLDAARELAQQARTQFWDESRGGYFDTREGQSDLFVRTKSMYDGAIPCGNSVMVHNLLGLHEVTRVQEFMNEARATLQAMSTVIARQPTGPVLATLALKRMIDLGGGDLRPAELGRGEQPVHVTVEPSDVRLGLDQSATIAITLRIRPGMHVNAHEPGEEFLVPLRVQLIGGDGLDAEVDYPEATAMAFDLTDEKINAHVGEIVIRVHVRRIGPLVGRPQLVLAYQACTDKACLAPVTQVLPVRIIEAP